MIRHLRWKVVATNMLLISLVLLAVFAAVFFISRDNYRKNVQQQLYQALEQGDYGISQPGVDSIPCFVAEVYGSGTVRVAGNSYYDLSDETRLADIVTAALHRTADSGTLDEYHLRYLRQTGYATTAIAFTDTYLEYTSLRTLLSACSLVGSVALVVLFLCSYLLSGVVTKPVGAAWAQQEQFLSDASHELKTPLAAIRLLTDSILQTDQMDMETVRDFVTDIGSEAERLSRITEDLLRLTRLDSDLLDAPETVEVAPVLEQVMRMMSLLAQKKGTELTYRMEENCRVSATKGEVHQVIYNLTDNAVKYSGKNGKVRVELRHEDHDVVLTVADNGPGIPEEDLPKVFERFYRVDKARSRAAGGTGLGLSIVQDTVKKRGGTVSAANRAGGGAVFTVRWPEAEGGDHS